jgi:hypothetical protein
VLVEIHEDWLTAEKAYLTFENLAVEESPSKLVALGAK